MGGGRDKFTFGGIPRFGGGTCILGGGMGKAAVMELCCTLVVAMEFIVAMELVGTELVAMELLVARELLMESLWRILMCDRRSRWLK